MRFKRYDRCSFVWTSRKEAALLRRLRLEREAYPLFSDVVAAGQPTVDQVKRQRATQSDRMEREARQRQAASWRQARAAVWAIPDPDRAQVLRYWNTHRHFPGSPNYLLYVVKQYMTGGLEALGRE